MAGPIKIAVLADTRNALVGFKSVEGAAERTGSKVSKFGGAFRGAFVAAGAAIAAAGVVDGFKATIGAAADMNAAVGATKQIFGDASAQVLKFGDNAASSLGVSKAEALDAAKQFGAFYTAIGFTTKQAASMSTKFTDAAGNLAAFGDSTPTEALEAMTSALRGEYDPLQKYIPTVNAAAVQQKAMELTGKRNAKALTDQEKALALQALVYGSVANKAGKAERAQGGYTQEMSKLKAQLTDIGASIGTAFLPAITKAATWINHTLIPGFKDLSSKYGPQVKSFFTSVGSLASNLKMPSLNLDLSGFSGVVDALKGYFATVQPIVMQVVGTIMSTMHSLQPQVQAIFSSIASIVRDAFTIISAVVNASTSLIKVLWAAFGTYIVSYLRSALSAVVSIVSGVFQILKGIFQVIAGVLTGDWGKAWDGVKNIVNGARGVLIGIFNAIAAAVRLFCNVAKSLLLSTWAAIKAATASAWNAIKSFIGSAVNAVRSAVTSAWNSIRSATSNAFNSVRSTIASGISSAVSTVRAGVTNMVSAFRSIVGGMVSAGANAIRGFINGMSSMLSSVVSKAHEIARSALNAAKSALGIASPSKAFRTIGRFVGLGFIQGLTGTESKIVSTVKSLAAKVESAFPDISTFTGTGKNRHKAVSRNRTGASLLAMVEKQTTALLKLSKRRDGLAARFNAANQQIVDFTKARAEAVTSIASTVASSFKLIDDNGATSILSILSRAKRAVALAQTFSRDLATLKARGLNPKLIEQLANAGPEAAASTAKSLAGATNVQLSTLNAQVAQLGKIGTTAGESVAGALYDAGIKAARGIVAGMAKERKGIETMMLSIAVSMQTAIKTALGIKRPARVKAASLYSATPTLDSALVASATSTARPVTIVNNFNGVVGDPIQTATMIERTFKARMKADGRPIAVTP